MDVVQAAWHKVAGGADRASLETLKAAYDASRHPRVLDGNMAIGQAKEIVARHFDTVADGNVTWDEFLQYHVRMSHEVDRGRSVDRDGTFVAVVVQQWRLDKDAAEAMRPTGIIPSTLDCPQGLKQTRNLDLVWPASEDGSNGGLRTFKSVVKSRFGRRVLPEHLRGYFAYLQEEVSADVPVKACTARSAFLSPLSIVWKNSTGGSSGLKEVVSPNVELAQLPADLREAIMPHADAEKLHGPVNWLALEAVYNPTYKKSSDAFGVGAQESASEVLALKRKVFEGTNCGQSWHGHTGKFTDSFHGGPYSFSGLNTASRR